MLFTMSGLEARAASYSITVSNLTAPETITAGDSFDIKGTIRSTYTIKSAKIGICDKDGKWISGHYTTKKPAKKIYGLSNANDKLHIDTLSKGTYYLKVYVTDSKNHKKTAVKQEFKIKAASAFSIKDLSVPEKLTEGDTFSVKGTVKSEYNITSIKIGVCDTEGNWLSGHYTTRKPAKKTYSLANAGSSMKFSTLTPGKYCFTVQATDSNKTTETILKNEFTVVKKPSKITVSGYTYPVSLKESSSFTLKGTVKSVYNIKKVRVGIWNNDTGKWYSGMMAEFKPNKTTFDISQADKEIRFSDLTEGTYYYKVYVSDTEGYSKSVIKKKFNVSKIASKFTVSSNVSYPSIMTGGSSFSLVGTVNSAVELDSVTIGICDSEGKRISGFNKTVKNIKEKKFYETYRLLSRIKGLFNNDIKEKKAIITASLKNKEGGYEYRFIAEPELYHVYMVGDETAENLSHKDLKIDFNAAMLLDLLDFDRKGQRYDHNDFLNLYYADSDEFTAKLMNYNHKLIAKFGRNRYDEYFEQHKQQIIEHRRYKKLSAVGEDDE